MFIFPCSDEGVCAEALAWQSYNNGLGLKQLKSTELMSVRLGGRESKVSRSEAKGLLTQSEGKPIQCSSHLERLAKQQFDCGWWCFQHRSSCPSEITHALFQDDQNQLESLLVTDKELQLPEVRMVNLVSLRFPNKCISSQPLLLSGGPPDCSTMSATSK